MRKIFNSLLLPIFVLLLFVQTAHAAVRSGESIVIPEDETINESLFTSGQTISIQGTIDGDVFCSGQTITIDGTVNGDVICAAQTIFINGTVNGNVRSVGQTLDIRNAIQRNVMFFGQSINLTEEASVSGELLMGVQSGVLEGTIGKNISGGGQSITINGSTGPVDLDVESLTVGSDASIAGNIIYTSERDAQIASGSSIAGTLSKHEPQYSQEKIEEDVEKGMAGFAIFFHIMSFITLLTAALLISLLFPKQTRGVLQIMENRIWPSIGWGFAAFIGIPILFIILLITVLGIPLAFILLFFYIILLLIARAFVSIYVGDYLFGRVIKKKVPFVVSTIVGVIITWVLFQIPIIGWLASFVGLLWGLGAYCIALKHKIRN